MTLSVTQLAAPLGARLVQETAAGPTPKNNVSGAPGSVFMIEYDNTPNAGIAYLKLYDSVAPTVGTTPASMTIPIAANARRAIAVPEGIPFSTGISFAVTATPDQANTGAPTGNVIVRLVTS